MLALIRNNNLSTGFVAKSLQRFCVQNNFECTPPVFKAIEVATSIHDEVEICMTVSEKSLAKEWDKEDDSVWESYLN